MTGYKKFLSGRELTIGIARMPYRKKLCLVVEEGNTITKYATFNDNKSAYEFLNKFADFIEEERFNFPDWSDIK